MLDINYIRENPKIVEKSAKDKGLEIDIQELLKKDEEWRELLQKVESTRANQNKLSKERPSEEEIEKIKGLKQELSEMEDKLAAAREELDYLLLQVPNIPAKDVHVGKDDTENKILSKWGKPKKFDFEPKDHVELGENLDIIDIQRAAKISGARFYYLKGDGALLEFALLNFVLDKLKEHNFVPVIPPVFIKKEAMRGMGYLEHGGEDEMYVFDKDNLVLVGTSEQSIGPMHMDEVLKKDELPLRYAGFSSCFRREAGSYGKDTRGILRVHQFDKVEMFSYAKPEDSDGEHDLLLSIEEDILQSLNIPYQVVKMCTGDLGAPVARKYDLEAWIPTQEKYREVTSTSNTTDFQARRLNIKYRDGNEAKYIHMLNGTGVAMGRMIIAILENYQQEDGSVKLPEALVRYMGGREIINGK